MTEASGIVNRSAKSLLVAALALCAGCFENHNEREADRITRAVIDNDLKPVEGDIAKGISITRVKVAQWSDELNAQGKLISVKETTEGCEPGLALLRREVPKARLRRAHAFRRARQGRQLELPHGAGIA